MHRHGQRAASSGAALTAKSARRPAPTAAGAPVAASTRRSRCRRLVTAAAYSPYPFCEGDYHRVGLQMVQTASPAGPGVQTGYFLLMRTNDREAVEDPDRALVMSVGGDTLTGVAMLAQGMGTGTTGGRPLSLDLMWQVLQRGQEVSKRTWSVLRVAVVELRGNTFIGRIFFGDAATGEVAWDCDCRPSDACWLALKSKAPIFIHRSVWEDSAMLLRDIQRSSEGRQAEAARDKTQDAMRLSGQLDADADLAGFGGDDGGELTPTAVMTRIRPRDPEPIKLLKMTMRVALQEENYGEAARIRDHPWMRLHVASALAAQLGDLTEADRCDQQLADALRKHEQEEEWQARQLGRSTDRRSGGGGGGGPSGPGTSFM